MSRAAPHGLVALCVAAGAALAFWSVALLTVEGRLTDGLLLAAVPAACLLSALAGRASARPSAPALSVAAIYRIDGKRAAVELGPRPGELSVSVEGAGSETRRGAEVSADPDDAYGLVVGDMRLTCPTKAAVAAVLAVCALPKAGNDQ